MDSAGDYALDRRPGTHHPHSRSHDRNDKQDESHFTANSASRQVKSLNRQSLAEKMGMPEDKIRKILKISKEPISMETPIGDDEDSHLGDFHRGRRNTGA